MSRSYRIQDPAGNHKWLCHTDDEPHIAEELQKMQQEYEPLLPVERKLIASSIGIGLSLPVLLYLVSNGLSGGHGPG